MRRLAFGHRYDPEMDATTWSGYNPTRMRTTDPVKLAFREAKQDVARRAQSVNRIAISAPSREAREQAERNAAQAVRDAVAALEFALTALIETQAPTQYQKFVNQKQLHNSIVHLKTKCGVKFESATDRFSRKCELDR